MRNRLIWVVALLAWPAAAAERTFDFSGVREGEAPPGFRSTVAGQGKPGEWKIVFEEVAPLLAPLSPGATSHARQAVLAQAAQDPTDEHYPLLIFEDEVFKDFKLTTRFKLVGGTNEQMAGIAFRIQDEKNYYYIRASGLGGSFYFFRVVNGQLVGPIGSKVEITRGVWHELGVECRGSQITGSLDGKVIIPQLMQDTFAKGKIGFWTKSDSVTYFSDTRIVYTPLVPPAQVIVGEVARKYARLLGLQLYVAGPEPQATHIIGSKEPGEIGRPGGTTELEVITHGTVFYGKEKETVSVVMPVRDRNGDIIAAARVLMRSFPGQSEQNAVARATPVVKEIQGRAPNLRELVE